MNLYDKNSSVIELNNTDFNNKKVINKNFKNKYGLIIFYSPKCFHCTQIKELWNDLAIQYKNIFSFGAINCSKYTNLCSIFNIKYYPTIKYVTKKNNLYNYIYMITRDELIYFITNKINDQL